MCSHFALGSHRFSKIYNGIRLLTVFSLTFWILSSLRFFRVRISPVLFLVSSIFFHVFISSCLRRAIRLARSYASLSMLRHHKNGQGLKHSSCAGFATPMKYGKYLLFASLLSLSKRKCLLLHDLLLTIHFFCAHLLIGVDLLILFWHLLVFSSSLNLTVLSVHFQIGFLSE